LLGVSLLIPTKGYLTPHSTSRKRYTPAENRHDFLSLNSDAAKMATGNVNTIWLKACGRVLFAQELLTLDIENTNKCILNLFFILTAS